MYAIVTRVLRCVNPELQMSANILTTTDNNNNIRKTSIERSDAKLETPENASIKGPAYDLNFGSPNPIIMFLPVHIDVGAFLIRHVTIRQALELGTDEIRRNCLCSEDKLQDRSINGPVRLASAGDCATYTSDGHQVIIQLPSPKPNLSDSHAHSHSNGDEPQ